jgi:DNA-directed RNA polymerase specialized sigma24 family protein
MPSEGSVTHWLGRLRAGDPAAAGHLWQRYFLRLVRLARQHLAGTPRRAADEEDVALSAFDSFCRGAENGRFPQLCDRDNLWGLLVTLTAQKAIDLRRHENRQKRGGGQVLDEAGLAALPGTAEADMDLDQVFGREPTPEFAARLAEECERLLDRLDDAALRAVALAKMEGYSHEEIAARLGCTPRTVTRKLEIIRKLWAEEVAS